MLTRSLLVRLLGYPIKRIEVRAHVIWVLPEKGRPRFISKAFVWNGFREVRRRNAQSLKILSPRYRSELATVMNPNKNSVDDAMHHTINVIDPARTIENNTNHKSPPLFHCQLVNVCVKIQMYKDEQKYTKGCEICTDGAIIQHGQ